MKRFKVIALLLLLTTISVNAGTESKDKYNYKKLPELLLDFANTRFQAYFCYNMCTFKNAEKDDDPHWGRCYGDEPVSMFQSKEADTDQWAQMCLNAKMTGGWLITKHTGGFCIWDSKFTTYDVGSAQDKTDIVDKFVKSFRKAGLKVGLYFSIIDYNFGVENGSVTQRELDFVKSQITELLTNYGPIDYINFDSWSTWPNNPDFDDIHYGEILALVKSLQPNCLIVSHTYESNLAHAEVPFADAAGRDFPYHPDFTAPTAGSDIAQQDWWWDPQQTRLKPVDVIINRLETYNSHNGVYILSVAPNTDGVIGEPEMELMREVGRKWTKPADVEKPGDDWGYSYNVNKNKAFMKHAVQSSTADFIRDMRAYPRAEIAVDGVTASNSEMEQTSITKRENNPWWRVNLGEMTDINKITIYNCSDTYKQMLKNFTVEVWDGGGNVVWSSHQEDVPDLKLELFPKGVMGQYIHIKLHDRAQLAIGEVIVE